MPSRTSLNNSTLGNWKTALEDVALNGTAEQQSQLVGQYYSYLSTNGHAYGNLAYQASQNTGFAGALANNYMIQIAQKEGVVVTDTMRQSIMVSLAISDAQARIEAGGSAIPPSQIFNYHVDVFRDKAQISGAAWTGTIFEQHMGSGTWLLGMGPADQNGGKFTVVNLNSFLQKIGDTSSSAHTEFVNFMGAVWNDGVLQKTWADSTLDAKTTFLTQVAGGLVGSWNDIQVSAVWKVVIQGLIRDTWDDCFDAFENYDSQPGVLTAAAMAEQCFEASTLSKLSEVLFEFDATSEANSEFFRRFGEEAPSWFNYLTLSEDGVQYASLTLDSWLVDNPMLLEVVAQASIDELVAVNDGVDFNNFQSGQVLDLPSADAPFTLTTNPDLTGW